jgi:tetratricopeptide (TPR) repeat protein
VGITADEDHDTTLADHFKAVGSSGRGLDAARMLESLNSKLFDSGTAVTVGRFVVRDRLGAGGMGVVMSAYDPQLQRTVAVKVLHDAGDPAEQKRLLEEARAMAKVGHPNLVTVYEAGTHHDSVFIAMEFVERGTLGDWIDAAQRPWREVVGIFIGAARGLAAIHEAGMVHRDFKPDNVLIGDDGRALVSDFGLARPQRSDMSSTELEVSDDGDPVATMTRGVAGTPNYISPEQWKGEGADAASDQWSFFVALHQALHGQRPFDGTSVAELCMAVINGKRAAVSLDGPDVPAWLDRLIDRGLSLDPAERFGSMAEVAAALEAGVDDQRARMVRVAAVAVLGTVVVAGGAIAAVDHDICEDVDVRLAQVWTEDRRAELASRFEAASGAATWAVIEPRIDERVQDWRAQRRDACEATHVRGEQSDDGLDLRMRCLDRRADELEALLATYDGVTEANRHIALDALANLRSMAECADVDFLWLSRPMPETPEQREAVARLRKHYQTLSAQLEAGKLDKDDTSISDFVADARALDYEPALAEALMLQGKSFSIRGEGQAAAELYERAFEHALATHHLEIQVWSSVVLVFVYGNQLHDYDAAQRWGRQAKALVRAHGHFPAAERSLENNLGVAAHGAGELEVARTHYEQALRLIDEAGLTPFNAIRIEGNLGILARQEGELEVAAERLESARAKVQKVLGGRHPMLGQLGNSLATTYAELGRLEDAEALYRESIVLLEEQLGPRAKPLCHPLNNLGEILLQQGKLDEALKMLDRAIAIWLEKTPDDPQLVDPLSSRADILLQQGRLDDARVDLDRATQIESKTLDDDRRALVMILRAQLIASTEPERASELVAKAAELDVKREHVRKKLEAWRTKHPPSP